MYDKLTDEEIIHQILPLRPNQCFELLYNRHATKVYKHCLTITHNTQSAQDFTHDIFIKIFTRLDRFKYKAKFSTWLYAVTHNYCIDQSRVYKRIPLKLTDTTDWPDIAEPEQINVIEEQLHLLRKSVETLSLTEQTILQVRYEESKSIEEIAQLYNLSQSAVKMRLKRIRQKLWGLLD